MHSKTLAAGERLDEREPRFGEARETRLNSTPHTFLMLRNSLSFGPALFERSKEVAKKLCRNNRHNNSEKCLDDCVHIS